MLQIFGKCLTENNCDVDIHLPAVCLAFLRESTNVISQIGREYSVEEFNIFRPVENKLEFTNCLLTLKCATENNCKVNKHFLRVWLIS